MKVERISKGEIKVTSDKTIFILNTDDNLCLMSERHIKSFNVNFKL